MSYTLSGVKRLPAPTVRRLLRERGYTLTDVAKRRNKSQGLVSRVVRKLSKSDPVWTDIAQMLNGRRAS